MSTLNLFESPTAASLAPVKRSEKGAQPGSRQPEVPVPATPSSSPPPVASAEPGHRYLWETAKPESGLDVHFLAFCATCRGWGVGDRINDPETGKADRTRAQRWANYLLRGVESDRPGDFDAGRWRRAIDALPALFGHLVERPGEEWKGVEG